MSNKKFFFKSPEWQAFIRPFKVFMCFLKNEPPPPTPEELKKLEEEETKRQKELEKAETMRLEKLKAEEKELARKKVEDDKRRREEETQRIIQEEATREEFLLSKFERRKLERDKRKQDTGELEETVIDPDRPSIADTDFPQYTLDDFMEQESPDEEEVKARKISLPEGGYQLPNTNILLPVPGKAAINSEEIERKKNLLQDTLDSFRIDAIVSGAVQGPRITRYDIRPAQGVNVDSIASLHKNMAMELEAESLRVLAPVPGKPYVGVEIPNEKPEKVSFRELIENNSWSDSEISIPLALGKNTSGEIRVMDLARAPHLLIAGATGAGKSVCINTIVMSMVFRFTPEDLQLIMVDPKVVELTAYQKLPHLIAPVITETKKVPSMLKWVVAEMKRRYKILALAGARNIAGYNSRELPGEKILDEDEMPIPDKFPFMVVIIDELADIMMTAGPDVETSLAQIAQLSRAVGIHTIIATQRPSVNVITGIIKANYPTRIAFQVSSHVDSRTIIDGKGAEQLLGRGDMLLVPPGASVLERLQGALVEDDEIDKCVEELSDQMDQSFEPGLEAILTGNFDSPSTTGAGVSADDELIKEAMEIIARDRKASTSYIQRRLRIGYNRAATIMEKLEEMGVVGPQIGSSPREIFIE